MLPNRNYKKYLFGIFFLLLFTLFLPSVVHTDEARYFYDSLGRLVGVVDSQGNTAVYKYDEVGNLLAIERFTSGGTGIGIFFFAPTKGLVGTEVEIRGFGFSATPTDNQVDFNGTAAIVVSSTTDSIVATVPDGATTGPIGITNSNGTATSQDSFTVLVPPIITGIVPNVVAQGSTGLLTIEGFNLADTTSVTFSNSGLTAIIQVGATSQSLPIRLSVSDTVPPGDYTFSIDTPIGFAESDEVVVTVAPEVGGFGISKLSVFMPIIKDVPATAAPSGPGNIASSPTSVKMPVIADVPSTSAPEGPGFVVSPPTSVEFPVITDVPAATAPSGSSMSVAPPESVFMPE